MNDIVVVKRRRVLPPTRMHLNQLFSKRFLNTKSRVVQAVGEGVETAYVFHTPSAADGGGGTH